METINDIDVQCTRCHNRHKESERIPELDKKHGWTNLVCPRCGGKNFYDITPWYAWCWRSGLIEMGPTPPADQPDGAGAIVIARGGKAHLVVAVQAVARHGMGASQGKLLVPGIPEAELLNHDPVDVLRKFVDWCAKGNGKRYRCGVVFGIAAEG